MDHRSPHDLVSRFAQLQKTDRPIVVLKARLLATLDALDGPRRVGLGDVEAIAERTLGLSRRAAWNLYVVGTIFQTDHAFGASDLSEMKTRYDFPVNYKGKSAE